MGKVKPTRDMELGRHARKAAAVIRDRGHTTGTLENGQGQVCLVGGMRKAVKPMGRRGTALSMEFNNRFGAWMKENYPQPVGCLDTLHMFLDPTLGHKPPATMWNDHVLKTQEETLAWLDKFADAMDPQR